MRILLSTLFICCAVGCIPEEPEEGDVADAPSADQIGDEKTSTTTQASTTEGFVAGAGDVNDDFGDEGEIDSNSHTQSMATGLWQAILWADGAIESNGSAFDTSDIDCDFGPNTTAATRNWQSTHGVSVDGSAGPQTLSRADANLRLGSVFVADWFFVSYVGSHHSFTMIRIGDQVTPSSFRHAYMAIGTDGVDRVVSYSSGATCSSLTWLG